MNWHNFPFLIYLVKFYEISYLFRINPTQFSVLFSVLAQSDYNQRAFRLIFPLCFLLVHKLSFAFSFHSLININICKFNYSDFPSDLIPPRIVLFIICLLDLWHSRNDDTLFAWCLLWLLWDLKEVFGSNDGMKKNNNGLMHWENFKKVIIRSENSLFQVLIQKSTLAAFNY